MLNLLRMDWVHLLQVIYLKLLCSLSFNRIYYCTYNFHIFRCGLVIIQVFSLSRSKRRTLRNRAACEKSWTREVPETRRFRAGWLFRDFSGDNDDEYRADYLTSPVKNGPIFESLYARSR